MTIKSPPMPPIEELLKHYNLEVLEMIKHGDAKLKIFKDHIVISRGKRPRKRRIKSTPVLRLVTPDDGST